MLVGRKRGDVYEEHTLDSTSSVNARNSLSLDCSRFFFAAIASLDCATRLTLCCTR